MTDDESLARSLRTFDQARALLQMRDERRAAAKEPARSDRRRAEKTLCKELGITRKRLRKMGIVVAVAMLEDKLEALKTGQAPLPKGLGASDA